MALWHFHSWCQFQVHFYHQGPEDITNNDRNYLTLRSNSPAFQFIIKTTRFCLSRLQGTPLDKKMIKMWCLQHFLCPPLSSCKSKPSLWAQLVQEFALISVSLKVLWSNQTNTWMTDELLWISNAVSPFNGYIKCWIIVVMMRHLSVKRCLPPHHLHPCRISSRARTMNGKRDNQEVHFLSSAQ